MTPVGWLRASCPGGLIVQLKSEKLMVFPSTANGFRVAVSALRSLHGKEGASYHTFTLPEDRCVRLLVKNLGRGMNECRPGEAGIPEHSCPGTHSGAFRPSRPAPRQGPNTATCECRWSRSWLRKARCNVSAASISAKRSLTADTVRRLWGFPPHRWPLYPAGTASVLWQ